VYLRNANHIVYYDRSAGGYSARDWLDTTGAITLSGNTASWLTRSNNQKAVLTSLLPSGATVSDAGAYITAENNYGNTVIDWEPYSHILIDAGAPSSTQFLTDLQWGASGFTPTTATLVQSTAGQAFDGAKIGTNLVMFMRNWPATPTGTTFPASGATTIYVSDLTPNTTYTITGTGTPTSATTDSAGVASFAATGTGNISVASGGTPTASTPTFFPSAGTYSTAQSVTISTATVGATICYTTDGTTPTANGAGACTHGSTYTGAVTVASSQTLQAIASKSGYLDSTVGSAAYVITSAVADPTFSPIAGTYTGTQTVTISTTTVGATICYTSDGSTPTTNGAGACTHGTTYTSAITVSASETLKAIASESGDTDSNVVSAAYVINPPPTSNTVVSGSVTVSGTFSLP
jgi:hypothetical protein